MRDYDSKYQKNKKTLVTIILSILVMVLLIVLFSLFMTGRAKETTTTNPRPPVQKSTKKDNENIQNVSNTTNTTSKPENTTEDTNTVEGNEVDNTIIDNTVVDNTIDVSNTTVDPNSNTTTDPNSNTAVDISGLIPKDKNKVSVDIKPNSLTVTGVTLTIDDTNSNKYMWTPDAKVQRYTAEEGWKDLIELVPQEQQDMITYDLYPYEEKIDWTTRYGTLGPGSYRVVKSGESGEYYFEFNVAGDEQQN